MSYKSVDAIRKEGQERVDEEYSSTLRREDDQAIMWWALDAEPGFEAKVGFIDEGSALFKNLEKLGVYPFKNRAGRYLIFDAQYRMASGGKSLEAEAFPEGALTTPGAHPYYLIMSFVAGFQIEACEMMMVIGELSSQPGEDGKKKVEAQDGGGEKTAPKPAAWFEWPEEEKVLLNKLYKRTKDMTGMEVFIFAKRSRHLARHWWLQVYLWGEGGVCKGDRTWPIPGEFVGLGVRLLRGLPWGEQKSSPFIYSGQWIDGVYLTSGVITEVIEPTDTIAYPRYKVKWHNVTEPITMNPSDFCEYRVDDKVAILKDVSVTKQFQSSEDDDVKAGCDKSKWMLVPLTYYSDQGKQEE